jgi:hypothetical protein
MWFLLSRTEIQILSAELLDPGERIAYHSSATPTTACRKSSFGGTFTGVNYSQSDLFSHFISKRMAAAQGMSEELEKYGEAQVPLPRVAIKFCVQCKWNLRAAYVGSLCSYSFDPPSISTINFLETEHHNSYIHLIFSISYNPSLHHSTHKNSSLHSPPPSAKSLSSPPQAEHSPSRSSIALRRQTSHLQNHQSPPNSPQDPQAHPACSTRHTYHSRPSPKPSSGTAKLMAGSPRPRN